MNKREESGTIAEDRTLVQACLRGDEQAWELFVTRYRPVLYLMALSMTRDGVSARELSDSLWAELFGTRTDQDGSRVSKLALFSGKGSLHGWLRTLLAQEYVNRIDGTATLSRSMVRWNRRLRAAAVTRQRC